jgi:hypothetical protein
MIGEQILPEEHHVLGRRLGICYSGKRMEHYRRLTLVPSAGHALSYIRVASELQDYPSPAA